MVLKGEDTISDVAVLESRDSREGFEVRRISDHILPFTFDKKEEVERIMSNALWSFDKHLVVL